MKTKRNSKRLLVISLILLSFVSGCTEEEATIACAPDEEECATETEEGFAFGPTAGIAAGAAAVVALAGGLSGGGDDSNSGASSVGNSLRATAISTTDFNVVSSTSRTEESMKDWINNENRFYSNMPSAGGGISAGQSARNECIKNMRNNYGSIIKNGLFYEFKLEVDITNCNSISDNVNSEIKSTHITKMNINSSNSNSEISELKFNDISYSSYLYRDFREVLYNNNNKYVYRYMAFNSSDETAPCLSAVNNVFDGCEENHLWKDYYNNDLTTVTGIYVIKFRWNNVVEGNGTFKESGSISFRRDDWTGYVEFIGTNNPSNYYMTNGSAVITGTLDTSQISNRIDLHKPQLIH